MFCIFQEPIPLSPVSEEGSAMEIVSDSMSTEASSVDNHTSPPSSSHYESDTTHNVLDETDEAHDIFENSNFMLGLDQVEPTEPPEEMIKFDDGSDAVTLKSPSGSPTVKNNVNSQLPPRTMVADKKDKNLASVPSTKWTDADDALLKDAVSVNDAKNWKQVIETPNSFILCCLWKMVLQKVV
jgi:hypothetical protein